MEIFTSTSTVSDNTKKPINSKTVVNLHQYEKRMKHLLLLNSSGHLLGFMLDKSNRLVLPMFYDPVFNPILAGAVERGGSTSPRPPPR